MTALFHAVHGTHQMAMRKGCTAGSCSLNEALVMLQVP